MTTRLLSKVCLLVARALEDLFYVLNGALASAVEFVIRCRVNIFVVTTFRTMVAVRLRMMAVMNAIMSMSALLCFECSSVCRSEILITCTVAVTSMLVSVVSGTRSMI